MVRTDRVTLTPIKGAGAGGSGPRGEGGEDCKGERERSSRGGKVTRVWLARGKGPKKITEYRVRSTDYGGKVGAGLRRALSLVRRSRRSLAPTRERSSREAVEGARLARSANPTRGNEDRTWCCPYLPTSQRNPRMTMMAVTRQLQQGRCSGVITSGQRIQEVSMPLLPLAL